MQRRSPARWRIARPLSFRAFSTPTQLRRDPLSRKLVSSGDTCCIPNRLRRQAMADIRLPPLCPPFSTTCRGCATARATWARAMLACSIALRLRLLKKARGTANDRVESSVQTIENKQRSQSQFSLLFAGRRPQTNRPGGQARRPVPQHNINSLPRTARRHCQAARKREQ